MQLPIHNELLAAFRARDSERLSSLYAEDAVFTVPGRPPVHGRGAIRRMLTEDFQDSGFSLDLQELRTIVSPAGDFACARGTFHLDFTNPQTTQSQSVAGSYVQVFRVNPSGSWEVVEDISSPGPTDSSSE